MVYADLRLLYTSGHVSEGMAQMQRTRDKGAHLQNRDVQACAARGETQNWGEQYPYWGTSVLRQFCNTIDLHYKSGHLEAALKLLADQGSEPALELPPQHAPFFDNLVYLKKLFIRSRLEPSHAEEIAKEIPGICQVLLSLAEKQPGWSQLILVRTLLDLGLKEQGIKAVHAIQNPSDKWNLLSELGSERKQSKLRVIFKTPGANTSHCLNSVQKKMQSKLRIAWKNYLINMKHCLHSV